MGVALLEGRTDLSPLSVQMLTECDSLRGLPARNTIDHELCDRLNRFIAYQNPVITNRQPERRTSPIALSKEATHSRPGEPALGDPQFREMRLNV
jgi:hypothetical protein